MKKKFSSKKSAFSLVELSIVLIIIGLLVAGVTGGAALIKNAETRAIIAESNQFKTLFSTFYGNYNYFPGDYNLTLGGSGATNGNGNGQIEANNNTGISESNLAWIHLKGLAGNGGGIVNAQSPIAFPQAAVASPAAAALAATTVPGGVAFTSVNTGYYFPGSKAKGGGWHVDYFNSTPIGANTSLNSIVSKHALILSSNGMPAVSNAQFNYNIAMAAAAATGGTYTAYNATTGASAITLPANAATNFGVFTPTDALAIDIKADDAGPSTGEIRIVGNWAPTASAYSCASGTAGSTIYDTTRTQRNCALSFDLDI